MISDVVGRAVGPGGLLHGTAFDISERCRGRALAAGRRAAWVLVVPSWPIVVGLRRAVGGAHSSSMSIAKCFFDGSNF